MEKRGALLNGNQQFFDSKPLTMKAWDPNMDVMKENFDVLPTCIQLRIYFKYWGENCFKKSSNHIGKFVKVDQVTEKREKLHYARVTLEVKVDPEFPDQLTFVNEKGVEVTGEIMCEWKPEICATCKQFCHNAGVCKKAEPRRDWRLKTTHRT